MTDEDRRLIKKRIELVKVMKKDGKNVEKRKSRRYNYDCLTSFKP